MVLSAIFVIGAVILVVAVMVMAFAAVTLAPLVADIHDEIIRGRLGCPRHGVSSGRRDAKQRHDENWQNHSLHQGLPYCLLSRSEDVIVAQPSLCRNLSVLPRSVGSNDGKGATAPNDDDRVRLGPSFGPMVRSGASRRAAVRGEAGRRSERREGGGFDRRALGGSLRKQGLDVGRLDRIAYLHVASLCVEPVAFGARLFLALEAEE